MAEHRMTIEMYARRAGLTSIANVSEADDYLVPTLEEDMEDMSSTIFGCCTHAPEVV